MVGYAFAVSVVLTLLMVIGYLLCKLIHLKNLLKEKVSYEFPDDNGAIWTVTVKKDLTRWCTILKHMRDNDAHVSWEEFNGLWIGYCVGHHEVDIRLQNDTADAFFKFTQSDAYFDAKKWAYFIDDGEYEVLRTEDYCFRFASKHSDLKKFVQYVKNAEIKFDGKEMDHQDLCIIFDSETRDINFTYRGLGICLPLYSIEKDDMDTDIEDDFVSEFDQCDEDEDFEDDEEVSEE